MTFSEFAPCPASPTGWVEIADCCDDLDAVARMSAAELLAHPYVRQASAADALMAEACANE